MLMQNYLRTFMDFLEKKICFPIQAICIYASVFSVFLTVAARELFRINIVWGYEIASFFIIVLLYIGMPAALHHNLNLSVSFIYDICNQKMQKALRVLFFVLEFIVLVMIAVGFHAYMSTLGNVTLAASKFPNWLYYGVIGVGVWLSLLELVTELFDLMVKKDSSNNNIGVSMQETAAAIDVQTEKTKKEGV